MGWQKCEGDLEGKQQPLRNESCSEQTLEMAGNRDLVVGGLSPNVKNGGKCLMTWLLSPNAENGRKSPVTTLLFLLIGRKWRENKICHSAFFVFRKYDSSLSYVNTERESLSLCSFQTGR